MKNLKRGEINTALLLGAVIFGGATGYGTYRVCGEGFKPFVKEWIVNPRAVGSCSPSSCYVVQEITKPLTDVTKPIRVLEVGSGTGVCTRAITEVLKGKSYHLDAIEINPLFACSLQKQFKDTSTVVVHEADITQWNPTQKYDVIICTLPLNLLDTKTTKNALERFKKWIVPGGRISYVEGAASSKLSRLFMSAQDRAVFDKKYQLISHFRESHLQESKLVLRNIPAYYVHHLKF